jgi:hypothetical protein
MCALCGKLPDDCIYTPTVSYASLEELVSNHTVGVPGQTYLVNGDVYIWIEDTKSWVNVGPRPETAL